MKKRIKETRYFPNGQLAVFDEQGQQIPILQRSYHELWAELAVKEGFDPEGVQFQGGILSYSEDSGCWLKYSPAEYVKILRYKKAN